MDFTFRQLEIFRAVVVSGSITKASHRIGLSQPTISQQLAKLEESLGVQLINRNRAGSVSLTPAGDYWYRAAQDLTERVQTIRLDDGRLLRVPRPQSRAERSGGAGGGAPCRAAGRRPTR